ncbi:hypothetical protein DFH29DRAFT_996636 [Suillus ampliporus]|nr:hypothetical protein DFH29DRAFT_996636 [Suillus ampliporus]
MFPYSEATPAQPYMGYALFGQDIMEGYLRKHLAKYSCFVELGTELRSFQQHSTHVEARIGKTSNPDHPEELMKAIREMNIESAVPIGDIKMGGSDEDHWHMRGAMDPDLRDLLLKASLQSQYRPNIRMANKVWDRREFIVGDTAQCIL